MCFVPVTEPEPMHHGIARGLLPLGLGRTLIASPQIDGFSLSRIDPKDEGLRLMPLGTVACTRASLIGRVGPPDARLDVRWRSSLTFYGKRFDEFASEDPNCVLRRRIAASPLSRNVRQITRDEQFALTGSYYAVFRAILKSTHGLPVVLLSSTPGAPDSLPVMLLHLRNAAMARRFADLLQRLMRFERAAEPQSDAVTVDGIEVDELSADDVNRYFGGT